MTGIAHEGSTVRSNRRVIQPPEAGRNQADSLALYCCATGRAILSTGENGLQRLLRRKNGGPANSTVLRWEYS